MCMNYRCVYFLYIVSMFIKFNLSIDFMFCFRFMWNKMIIKTKILIALNAICWSKCDRLLCNYAATFNYKKLCVELPFGTYNYCFSLADMLHLIFGHEDFFFSFVSHGCITAHFWCLGIIEWSNLMSSGINVQHNS